MRPTANYGILQKAWRFAAGNAPGVGSVPLAEAKPVKKLTAEKADRGRKEEQAGVSGAVETPSEPTEYAKNRPRR